jgi:hypothetical protein
VHHRYAEGKSKNAKEFNCVQRGHQQALVRVSRASAFSEAKRL